MQPKIALGVGKKSMDPAQQHLRERKQVWNKQCSEFIANVNAFKPKLISFKRGLNGRGDPKASLPVSDIKNPFPPEIRGFLGNVAADFDRLVMTFAKLVSEADAITQEQSQYAQKRRKGKSDGQHASVEIEDILISEGSSPISRLWAHVSSLLSSDEHKNYRLSMLSMATTLFKNLVELEDAVLEKGIENIPRILNIYFMVSNNVNGLNLNFKKLNKPIKPSTPTPSTAKPSTDKTPASLSQPPVNNDRVEKMKANVLSLLETSLNISNADIAPFMSMYEKFRSAKDENTIALTNDRLEVLYDDLFNLLKSKVKDATGEEVPNYLTFGELIALQKEASLFDDQLIKLGSNFFTRLLKKYRHQFGIKDAASASRMEAYSLVRETKKQVDQLMNLLEDKTINVPELANKMSSIDELVVKIGDPLKLLNVLYKNKFYEKETDIKTKKIDPAGSYFLNQIKRDVGKSRWW